MPRPQPRIVVSLSAAMLSRRCTWQAAAAVAVTCAALFLGRPLVSEGYVFPDSHAYMEWPADFVLAGATRVMGARPVGYALFLDAFGVGAARVWAQTALSLAAWSALGWLAGRLPGVVVGCALALAPPVWRWNSSLPSESLTHTQLALGLPLALLAAQRGFAGRTISWGLVGAWAACALGFGWSRDANLALLPTLLLPALYVGGPRRIAVLLVGALVLAVGALDARRNERADWSLNNAILERVLPDPPAAARFEAAGMPVTPELREAAGSPGRRTQERLRETSPAFFEWTRRDGPRVYWGWVLARPASYAEFWRALGESNALDLAKYPPWQEIPAAGSAALAAWAFGPAPWATLLLVLSMLPALRSERRVRPEAALALLAAGNALVYAFLSYHADGVEAHRHMLLGIVLLRIAFWVALGVFVSFALAQRAGRAGRESGPTSERG